MVVDQLFVALNGNPLVCCACCQQIKSLLVERSATPQLQQGANHLQSMVPPNETKFDERNQLEMKRPNDIDIGESESENIHPIIPLKTPKTHIHIMKTLQNKSQEKGIQNL